MKKQIIAVTSVAGVMLVAGAGMASATTQVPPNDVNGAAQVLTTKNSADAGVNVVAPRTAGAQQQTSYSVTITSVPAKARAATQVYINGRSTGFSDGNWVNAWIIRPNGSQYSAGGNWVKAGKFALPVSFQSAGAYQVQLSLGQYPQEQYSQIVPITVTSARYDSKPVLTEDGYQGQRYLQASGTANLAEGKKVYVYVTRPGTIIPRYVGTAVVGADGSYEFTTRADQLKLDKNGHYTVLVSRSASMFNTIGISTYYNTVYQGK